MLPRLFNTGLRMGALGLKLLLTLYMARYFSLEELGTFGLIVGATTILMNLLGLRLDYVIGRDLVTLPPLQTAQRLRDLFAFYGLNYLLLLIIAAGFYAAPVNPLTTSVFVLALLLTIGESLSAAGGSALTSQQRPILANVIFFIRSAAWVVPVIILGLLDPAWRTAQAVLLLWLAGLVLALLVNAAIWRALPWRAALRTPLDWAYIRTALPVSIPIWLGTVASIIAVYADRFIAESFLSRETVGIISFYSSFAVAISALLTSGVFAFAYPQLVALWRAGETASFTHAVRSMSVQAAAVGAGLCVVIGGIVPIMGQWLGKPEFYVHAKLLWLMLGAVWLRILAEAAYYVLYARLQDRPIWLGNLFFMAVTLLISVMLVPTIGLYGVGWGAVCGAAFLLLYRLYYIFLRL